MSSIISGVFALFLVMWATVFGVDTVQVIAAHNTLAFVAQQAVRSEAVSGCWTPTTNQVVLNTLQAQGFPVAAVRLATYDAAPGEPFGAPVTVGLQATDHLDILGVRTPLTLTLAANDTATSQWVPTVGITANSACNTPSGLPIMSGAAQTTSGGGPFNGE